MNLNVLAEQDLSCTLEDIDNGFAREFTLYDTKNASYELCGIINDISLVFDTEGNAISGRAITISYRLSKLVDSSGNYIRPATGWQATWLDMSGNEIRAFVRDFNPDRRLGIGLLVLDLEFGKSGD